MSDEYKHVNIQEIIPLVERKPVLWDHRLELFKHKNATLVAWNEICSDYNKAYVNLSEAEKNNYRKIIIRKWRNVRDSWRKNLVKTVRGESNHKKYVFDKELMFLKKGMKIRHRNKPPLSPLKTQTLTTIDNDESSWHSEFQIKSESINNTDDFEEIDFPKEELKYDGSSTSKSGCRSPDKQELYHEMPSFSSYSQSTSISNQGESDVSHLLNSRQQKEEGQEDRHISFIKGVLPSLRNFNESQVLQFQMGILQLIQNIKENST